MGLHDLHDLKIFFSASSGWQVCIREAFTWSRWFKRFFVLVNKDWVHKKKIPPTC